MATGNLIVNIAANIGELVTGLNKGIEHLGKFERQVTNLSNKFTSLEKNVWQTVVAYAGLNTAMDLLEKGAQAQRIERTFKDVSSSMKISGEAIVDSMEEVTKGTIDRSDIMKQLIKGFAQELSPEKMINIGKMARMAAIKTGQDTASALEGVTEALAHNMGRQLKQMGLIEKEGMQLVEQAVTSGIKGIDTYTMALAYSEMQMAKFNLGVIDTIDTMEQLKAQTNELKEAAGIAIQKMLMFSMSIFSAINILWLSIPATVEKGLNFIGKVLDKVAPDSKMKKAITELLGGTYWQETIDEQTDQLKKFYNLAFGYADQQNQAVELTDKTRQKLAARALKEYEDTKKSLKAQIEWFKTGQKTITGGLKTAIEERIQIYKQEEDNLQSMIDISKDAWITDLEVVKTSIESEKKILSNRYENGLVSAKAFYDSMIDLELKMYSEETQNIQMAAEADKAAINLRIQNLQNLIGMWEKAKTALKGLKPEISIPATNDANVAIEKLKTGINDLQGDINKIDSKSINQLTVAGAKLGATVEEINFVRPTEELRKFYSVLQGMVQLDSEYLSVEAEIADAMGEYADARELDVEIRKNSIELRAIENQRILDEIKITGIMTNAINDEYNARMRLADSYAKLQSVTVNKTTFAEGFTKGIREASEELSNMSETGERVAEDLKNAFQSFFEDAFSGGKDAWAKLLDSMKSMFIKLLAQLATQAIAMPIIVTVSQQMGVGTDLSNFARQGSGTNSGLLGAGAAAFPGGAGATTFNAAGIEGSGYTSEWMLQGSSASSGMSALSIIGIYAAAFQLLVTLVDVIVHQGEKARDFHVKIKKGILTWGGHNVVKFIGFDLQEWWDSVEKADKQIIKGFGQISKNLKSTMEYLGMDISKFSEDWTKKIELQKDETLSQAIKRVGAEYASFVTGIDFEKFSLADETLADTVERIFTAIIGFKTLNKSIDMLVQGIEGSSSLTEQWSLKLGEANDNILELKNSLRDATDPTDIVTLGNQLMNAIYDRYNAEIQFVLGLEQKIKDLKVQLADLALNRAQTMIRLASQWNNSSGGIGLGGVITDLANIFNELRTKVIGGGTGQEQLGWLEQMMQIGEAWIAAHEQDIRDKYEPQIEINEQAIDILNKQLETLRAWEDLNDTVNKMLDDIMLTTSNPRDVYERIGLAQADVQRLQGEYAGATVETKAGIGSKLASAVQTYLNLAQEGYQRPSTEYQEIWSNMVNILNMLQSDSAVFATEAENTQKRITYLQEENVRLQGLMKIELEGLQPAIREAAAWLAKAYEKAYALRTKEIVTEIGTLETTLRAVIGEGTVKEYIDDLKIKAVNELKNLVSILQKQWGTTDLPFPWDEAFDWTSGLSDSVVTAIGNFFKGMPTSDIDRIIDFFANLPTEWQDSIRDLFTGDDPSKWIANIKTFFNDLTVEQQNLARNLINSLPTEWIEKLKSLFGVTSFQSGTNYVPKTGLAYLHQGEKVIPAGGGGDIYFNLSPTINASGDASAKEIWRELEDYAIQSVKGGRLGKVLQGVKRG